MTAPRFVTWLAGGQGSEEVTDQDRGGWGMNFLCYSPAHFEHREREKRHMAPWNSVRAPHRDEPQKQERKPRGGRTELCTFYCQPCYWTPQYVCAHAEHTGICWTDNWPLTNKNTVQSTCTCPPRQISPMLLAHPTRIHSHSLTPFAVEARWFIAAER